MDARCISKNLTGAKNVVKNKLENYTLNIQLESNCSYELEYNIAEFFQSYKIK